jgi:ABC-type transport system involved in cytochrome c biogenesis permease subunit
MIEKIERWWRSDRVQWMFSVPLTVVCLGLLMILVFWGTLYQVEHGLFAAQEKFFDSWFVWVFGVIPFPGAKLVLGLLMFNLLGYMINMLAFQPLKPGILLIHAGLLVMLIGGAITQQYGEESHLTLWEGESSNVSQSYFEWELAVWKRDGAVRDVYAVDTKGLVSGDVIDFTPVPVRVEVEQYYGNARAYQTKDQASPFASAMNISRIEEAKPDKEPSQNVAAGIFVVSAPDMEPKKVLLFGDDVAPIMITIGEDEYTIGLRHKKHPLPLLVRLIDFKKELHPGTEVPSSFSSLIEMRADGIARELTISMNKPLRHRGYTLFQQSYREMPDGSQSSTFAVTRNFGRLLPYVSTAMVVLGMLVHFVAMMIKHARKQRNARGRDRSPSGPPTKTLVTLGFLILSSITSFAQAPSVESMAKLPVLEGGRVMPLDSYARLKLLQFSGKSTIEDQSALTWLAQLLFVPENVQTQRVFMINHPEVAESLGINPEDRRRFSFSEMHTGLNKLHEMAVKAFDIPEEERSPVEKEILRVYHNVSQYSELVQALQFTLEHDDFTITSDEVKQLLELPPAEKYSFLDIFLRAPKMSATLEQVEKVEPSKWTDRQKNVFELSSTLFQWSQHHKALPITMIPLQGHGKEDWVSPWDILSLGLATPELRHDVAQLQEAARHYRAGQQLDFDLAIHTYERSVIKRAPDNRGVQHLDLELKYNRYELFYRAKLLYGLAFLLGMVGILTNLKGIRYVAVAFTLAGLVPHATGIIWRMMIMGRPPMTNLYATFLFVALIVVVLGLVIEWFQRNNLGAIMAGFAGLTLLLIAARFSSQGDTLGVVVAVLDSNFWLSTHVVCITIGYAGCVAAGIVGHVYLIQAMFKTSEHPSLRSTMKALYGLLAFGLIFSFLGTMLGGVWADQSWGRFWGWDPKENGALLIVLWCALLFHARIANMIGPRGLAVGSVLGVIIVIFAWLGVNLLGVGLHSYGFTSGLARGMWISIGIELLFLMITVPLAKKTPSYVAARNDVSH